MTRGVKGLIPFFSGESSTFTPVTSSYGQFAEVSGVARNLTFEIYLSASTAAQPLDFRLVQGMHRLEAETSDILYLFPATTYTQKTSSFTINTTKGAYMFALQAKISSASTTVYTRTVQAKWLGIG